MGASEADILLSKDMLHLQGRPHLDFGQTLHSLQWGRKLLPKKKPMSTELLRLIAHSLVHTYIVVYVQIYNGVDHYSYLLTKKAFVALNRMSVDRYISGQPYCSDNPVVSPKQSALVV